MVMLVAPSLSFRGLVALYSSGGLRTIAVGAAFNRRRHTARASSLSTCANTKASFPHKAFVSVASLPSRQFNFAHFHVKSAQMGSEYYSFGPYKISQKEVFYATDLSYAFVNLRPVLPGHVLICPRREVKRFVDLTADETRDLWLTAQNVGSRLECHHKASSLTFTIQDGPMAGQTVPHVHIHVIPRKNGDFEKNDEIYEAIDDKEKELKQNLDLDKEREDRSVEEMAQEADEYRKLFL